jgi:PAS domain S-box-containing protein
MVRGIRDNEGHLRREVEERRQAEQRSSQSEALYRLLVDHLPKSAVLLFDRDTRHTLTEGPFLEELGYRREQFKQRKLEEALLPDLAKRLRPHYERALRGEVSELEGTVNGRQFNAQYLPVRDALGSIIGGLVLARDVTEERQAALNEVELAIERERNKLLAAFVRDICHDFRTPLSVLTTNLYLYRREELAEKRIRRGITMQQQIDRLSRMLDQMVAMSTLEAGARLNIQSTDIGILLRVVHDRYIKIAAAKHVLLEMRIQPGLPKIEIDPHQFNQVLCNLIDNALQYTNASGIVTLEAWLADEHNELVIAVQDDGAGIPADDLPYVFDAFYRGDKARSAETGGAGLGLTLVKRIVHLHGGAVYAQSVQGKGARFEIYLPLSEDAADESLTLANGSSV